MIKPYLTYDQQIQKLVDNKELIITDKEYARRKLIEIGYFSLIGGYKNLFINPMTRKYENDTTFEDVVALYEFDESLRQLTFSYLIKIEQKLRQLIAYSFCAQYGEQQIHYLTRDNYNLNPRLTGEIDRLIETRGRSHSLIFNKEVYYETPTPSPGLKLFHRVRSICK